METVKIKLEPRTVIGKKVKRLRRQGYVPVHLYGAGGGSTVHQVEAKLLGKVLPQVGTNVPLMVEIEGHKEDVCFVRDVQRHPVSEDLLHVDFLRVDRLADDPVRGAGGHHRSRPGRGGHGRDPAPAASERRRREPAARCAGLLRGRHRWLDDFEKAVYVRDIPAPARVTILTDPDDMLARIGAPRIEAEDVVLEEDEELAEGEESETTEDEEA